MIDAKHRGLIRPYIFIQLVGGGFYILGQNWRTEREREAVRENVGERRTARLSIRKIPRIDSCV